MATSEPLSMRVIFKFALPLMGAFMTLRLLWGNDHRVWAVFPAVFIAVYLSAADVSSDGKHLYYRPFLSWRRLPDDVADARCTFLPALGYVRFKHFFPPFGLLFFIVERNSGRFIPFRRTALMERMISLHRRGEVSVSKESDARAEDLHENFRLATVLFPAVGFIAGVLMPVPWQHWSAPVKLNVVSRLLQFQRDPVILCLYALLLVMLTFRYRLQRMASLGLSFMLGTVVAFLVRLH